MARHSTRSARTTLQTVLKLKSIKRDRFEYAFIIMKGLSFPCTNIISKPPKAECAESFIQSTIIILVETTGIAWVHVVNGYHQTADVLFVPAAAISRSMTSHD